MRITGHYEDSYFIPDSLPPHEPPLLLNEKIIDAYGEAMLQLGKLNEMTNSLPDPKRFIKSYVIKEALLSSSIEGIHTTLLDVFTQPLSGGKAGKDTQLVMNYCTAIYKAVDMVKKEGLPISSRVILAAHKTLMEKGEGEKANPGHYRKQPVRVGALIPPPPQLIPDLMTDLEKYINSEEPMPLIKAGLAHVQFETIHPFLDGNGRIGRLLIALMLIDNKLLDEPILYLSYYFKKNQLEYYQRLDQVRTKGDFEGWVLFYLTAIKETSIDAHRRAKDIASLEHSLRDQITQEKQSTATMRTRLKALSIFFRIPIINIQELSKQLNTSYNTAHKIITDFMANGILVEETQQKRGRLFKFKPYIDVLDHNY